MTEYLISEDSTDIEAGLAPDYYGDDPTSSCDGSAPADSGPVAAIRGLFTTTRSAFSRYPRRPGNLNKYGSAKHRGWGSGWPSCRSASMASVVGGGVRLTLRREVAPIVATLLNYAEKSLDYPVRAGQTGGFACRSISGTDVASNHSWGLAVDINWQRNPMSRRFVCDLPPELITAFWKCGFYWGGWYSGGRYDPMHFEYIGSPGDVARHLAKARALAGSPAGTKPPVKPPPADSQPVATKPPIKPAGPTVSLSGLIKAYNAGGKAKNANADVRQLQSRLNELGFKCGTADGYYGGKTKDALMQYRAKKYDTHEGHPDTVGPPGRQSLTDLGFHVIA